MLTKTQNFIEKNIKLLLFTEVLFFAIFTYFVMNEISPINKYDENAYLDHAKTILISENYWYLGDRNRMPLFNYFLSIFYNLEASEIKNYYNLKYANLGLTSFLAFLFFIKIESKFKNKFIFLNLSFLILIIPTFALIHQLLVESIFFLSFSLLLVYFEQMNNNPNIKNSIKLGLVGALVYFLKYTGRRYFLQYLFFQ